MWWWTRGFSMDTADQGGVAGSLAGAGLAGAAQAARLSFNILSTTCGVIMQSRYAPVAAFLGAVTLLAGCGDDHSLDPTGSTLTASEVRAMGDAVVGAASMVFNDGVREGQLIQGTWDLGTGEFTMSVDLTWPCEAGVLDVTGTTTGSLDFQTGSVNAVSQAVLTPKDCRFTHTPLGEGVTMNGDPNVRVDGELSSESMGGGGDLSARMTGAVLWEAQDGRSGRCEIDLTLEWTLDTLDSDKTVTGTVCGIDYGWRQ
jgi:hypothetical protein